MDQSLRRAELAAARRAHAAAVHNHNAALLRARGEQPNVSLEAFAALERAAEDVERTEIAVVNAEERLRYAPRAA